MGQARSEGARGRNRLFEGSRRRDRHQYPRMTNAAKNSAHAFQFPGKEGMLCRCRLERGRDLQKSQIARLPVPGGAVPGRSGRVFLFQKVGTS